MARHSCHCVVVGGLRNCEALPSRPWMRRPMAHSYPALLLLDSTDANRVRVWGTASRAARCGGELFGDVVGATQAGRNPGSKFGGASRADETGSCSDKVLGRALVHVPRRCGMGEQRQRESRNTASQGPTAIKRSFWEQGKGA